MDEHRLRSVGGLSELAMTIQEDSRCTKCTKLTPVEMDFEHISQVLKLCILCFKHFEFCFFLQLSNSKALADVLEALIVAASPLPSQLWGSGLPGEGAFLLPTSSRKSPGVLDRGAFMGLHG